MDKIYTEGSEKAHALKRERTTALAQVDLTIQSNEFIAAVDLVAPNGCRATTSASTPTVYGHQVTNIEQSRPTTS